MKVTSLPLCQIKSFDSNNQIILVSKSLAKQWGCRAGQSILIKAGMCNQKVTLKLSEEETDTCILLSKAALNSLNMPANQSVKLHYNSNLKSLSLGPIIGLYAVRSSEHYPYGEITSLLQELQVAGLKKGALVYVFSPQDIAKDSNTLRGSIYNFTKRRWVTRRFPIPDVVYDRILSRRLEKKQKVKLTRKHLLNLPSVNYFNQGYLDKWQVYKHLVSNPSVKKYLPETRLCKGMMDVIYMLAKYSQVYIKPANSSHGLGICYVKKKNNGYYGHYINWEGEEKIWQVRGLRDLSILLSRIIRRKKYIVQQGLNLSVKGEKPADIRVLMQKNGEGAWRFTTFIARIAAEGSKVSNFEHGGSLVSVYRLLKSSNKKKNTNYSTQKSALINFGKQVCKQLEMSMGKDFAELGLDMAVDVSGRLWLIEVNSRPARDLSTDSHKIPSNARLSVRRVIDYATWLAGFAVRSGGE